MLFILQQKGQFIVGNLWLAGVTRFDSAKRFLHLHAEGIRWGWGFDNATYCGGCSSWLG